MLAGRLLGWSGVVIINNDCLERYAGEGLQNQKLGQINWNFEMKRNGHGESSEQF